MSVNEAVATIIDSEEITSSKAEKLLGVTFERELKHATHINGLCRKVSNKIHRVTRTAPFTNFSILLKKIFQPCS